jgi:hypothetical protein
MQSLQLTAHVENNGMVQIKLPPEFAGQDIDVVLVIQTHQQTDIDSELEDRDDLNLLKNTRHEETVLFSDYLKNAD